ncbi:MAG: hypothetical protein OXP09_06270 [Gammaproteobacteria bacterium]|nr:hypothetical protein [Gammaproteobacteria bacterium]
MGRIDRMVRSGEPNTRTVQCATDADREALLAELARRIEAAGRFMMTVVPPAGDEKEPARRLDEEIRLAGAERHVLPVIDRARETRPACGTLARIYLFEWDVQRDLPVVLLMVGLDLAMADADLNRTVAPTRNRSVVPVSPQVVLTAVEPDNAVESSGHTVGLRERDYAAWLGVVLGQCASSASPTL